MLIETVPNVSEGRDLEVVKALAATLGSSLLDVHRDPDHHRSVFTAAGAPDMIEAGLVALAQGCIARIDVRTHHGAHPRFGALDVVPLIALGPDATPAHDLAAGLGRELAALRLGVYRYGDGARPLPEVRRRIGEGEPPDLGAPHPTAGSVCLGVRGPLVAFNVDLDPSVGLVAAKQVAAAVRGDGIRALGLDLPRQGRVQVSMNLVTPSAVGLQAAWDRVAEVCRGLGLPPPGGAEIVGLCPRVSLSGLSAELAALTGATDKVLETRLENGVG